MENISRNEQIIDGELDDNKSWCILDKRKYYGLNSEEFGNWSKSPEVFRNYLPVLLKSLRYPWQCNLDVHDFLF
jgi:hypothetical protein